MAKRKYIHVLRISDCGGSPFAIVERQEIATFNYAKYRANRPRANFFIIGKSAKQLHEYQINFNRYINMYNTFNRRQDNE